MTDSLRRCKPLRSPRELFAILAIVFSISASAQMQSGATRDSRMRHLLDAATAPAPATANDEIFWDSFETCGNGVIDSPSESCDRMDLGGSTCQNLGYTGGTLACDSTCHFDISECTGQCPVSCDTDGDCGACLPCFSHICLG
jgi:hypothetical protein